MPARDQEPSVTDQTIHDDDANDEHDELLDDFGREHRTETTVPAGEASLNQPEAEVGPPAPRLSILPDVDLGAPPRRTSAKGLLASRAGALSPVQIGKAHVMAALLWVYRFGFSTREVLDGLRGSKGDGLTKTLVERGLLEAFMPKNPTAIQARAYLCLSESGVAAVEEWSLEWEAVADDLLSRESLPAAYPDWMRISLLPPGTHYHCLGGRIRHARAQHDLLLQRWFLRMLLGCEACEPWGIRTTVGAVLPANWGPIVLRGWSFADEIESLRRRMNIAKLPHIPDLELQTEHLGGNGGLDTIEVELENARKRQDEVDAQVLRSAHMYKGRHLDDVAATRHTLIVSSNKLLTQQWIRGFERNAVPRWEANEWRKRVVKDTIWLSLPRDWEKDTSIAWNSQVLHNIAHPASLVKLHK